MARIIPIPVSFEFRTVRAKWKETRGRIVGLSFDPLGGWDLKIEVMVDRRRISVDFPRHEIPARLEKECDKAVDNELSEFGDDSDHWDKTIERVLSDFRPQLLVPSILDDGEETSLPADAWQLRDDFLRVPQDVGGVLEFLNKWGSWNDRKYMRLREILTFQDAVRNALLSSPAEWLEDFALDLDQKSEYPFFTMETVNCEPAICATVTIDLLRQVKFETCARPDCGQPFSVESRHHRKYCTQYCGHLESVRRNRTRPRAAKYMSRSRKAIADR